MVYVLGGREGSAKLVLTSSGSFSTLFSYLNFSERYVIYLQIIFPNLNIFSKLLKRLKNFSSDFRLNKYSYFIILIFLSSLENLIGLFLIAYL